MSQLVEPAAATEPSALVLGAMAWGVGPWGQGEFDVLRTVLGDAGRWPVMATLAEAVEALDGLAAPPELLLLAQPRPGYFSEDEAAAVGRVAPLSRLVVVAGTWCEGELRTGRPLPGTLRMYWYQFEAWWRRGLAARTAGECPPWADPLEDPYSVRPLRRTAALAAASTPTVAEQVFAAEVESDESAPSAASGGNCVAVDVCDYESFETLRIALRPYGWRCIWQPRHRPEVWDSHRARCGVDDPVPAAGIWDGGQLSSGEMGQLAAFSDRLAECGAQVLVLLDFPRAEHVAAAASVGAWRVLGKPYLVDGVAGELAAAVAARA
ncbi:MAG: hypothetical protein CMJ58_15430 [Planctomycetaceae bacterium]|nr:hypothetical protein [Planctomycetaceae bacterium]